MVSAMSSLPQDFLDKAREVLPKGFSFSEEDLRIHASDCTEDLQFFPSAVAYPTNSTEVSNLLHLCHQFDIAATPQGGQTGLSGGGLPLNGSLAISFKKMNQIHWIDEKNFMACVEPGVVTGDLQRNVAEKGLFYPPDPASKDSCFIGGNVAENSGGPRAVKYGVTSDFILNLEVALADGTLIETGANTLKNATGYDLTSLMVGSEGTLGVVTKIYVKLIPHPLKTLLLWIPFSSGEKACQKVAKIFMAGHNPSALEFMERNAIVWSLDYSQIEFSIPEEAEAFLLIELDGNKADQLQEEAEQIYELLEEHAIGEILLGEESKTKEKLWKIRRNCAEGVHAQSIYKEEDTVVPRYELPKLLRAVKELGKEYGFESVCYGHAGDGNLHVNILKGDLTRKEWEEELPKAIRKLFEECKKLGGTISGEHGIGYVQKNFLDVVFKEDEMRLMKGIKSVFDPKGILNPGKIW